jgi:hypothetical protein
MKRIVLALSALLLSATMFAQTPSASSQKAADVVKFKELEHDFGKIKQNVPVTYDFVFSNASNKPIVIESAIASCGCTTPVKPEAPVAKGKQDKVTAGFNAATLGTFTKSITIKVAGIDTPMEIKIKGEVLNEVDFAKYEKEKGSKKGK